MLGLQSPMGLGAANDFPSLQLQEPLGLEWLRTLSSFPEQAPQTPGEEGAFGFEISRPMPFVESPVRSLPSEQGAFDIPGQQGDRTVSSFSIDPMLPRETGERVRGVNSRVGISPVPIPTEPVVRTWIGLAGQQAATLLGLSLIHI